MSSFYFWHWRICVLMRLNKGAFYGCGKLTKIDFEGTISQWKAIKKGADWHYAVSDDCWISCTNGQFTI